jgi:hypothetical protein
MITLLEYILNLSKREFKTEKRISINFTKLKIAFKQKWRLNELT